MRETYMLETSERRATRLRYNRFWNGGAMRMMSRMLYSDCIKAPLQTVFKICMSFAFSKNPGNRHGTSNEVPHASDDYRDALD